MKEQIAAMKEIIRNTDNIVAIIGIGVLIECGAPNFLADDKVYEIEAKYHYSPEEILSTGFYYARKEKFFEFYKQEVLTTKIVPNESFEALKELQRRGKLKTCITQNIYGATRNYGLNHVIEMRGNVNENWCTKCGKTFTAEYMRNAKDVPLCDECNNSIRPGVGLYGEMIRNDLLTEAVNAIQRADVLLVLGTNINDSMIKNNVSNYPGDKLILITKNSHFTDSMADYHANGYVKDILPMIVW